MADAGQAITSATGRKVATSQREVDRLEEARHGTIALTRFTASVAIDIMPQAVIRRIGEPLDSRPFATMTKQKDVAK